MDLSFKLFNTMHFGERAEYSQGNKQQCKPCTGTAAVFLKLYIRVKSYMIFLQSLTKMIAEIHLFFHRSKQSWCLHRYVSTSSLGKYPTIKITAWLHPLLSISNVLGTHEVKQLRKLSIKEIKIKPLKMSCQEAQ